MKNFIMKKLCKKNQPTYLMVRGITTGLKNDFKSKCASEGITMSKAIAILMTNYVSEDRKEKDG